MALGKCFECSAPVSKSASCCPKCGAKFEAKKKAGCLSFCLIMAGIPAILILMDEMISAAKLAMNPPTDRPNFAPSEDKPLTKLDSPFSTPSQYLGMNVAAAAIKAHAKPDKLNTIELTSPLANLSMESAKGKITFADLELLETVPCYQGKGFDSELILAAVGIDSKSLEFVRKQTHYHTYYDHKRKLKVGVSCLFDGAPINVIFSSKYYLD